jgi:hypothetical protein
VKPLRKDAGRCAAARSPALRRVWPGRRALVLLVCGIVAAPGVCGAQSHSTPPIRLDLALINGLQVSETSFGIRDRIRVVTLATSGCTPSAARLFTLNPEAGSESVVDVQVQGRSIAFEIESHARSQAQLRIECLETRAEGGPPKTFTLSLDRTKAR